MLRLAAALLMVSFLAGCASDGGRELAPPDVGYDPDARKVTGALRHEAIIPSFDGTKIAAVVWEPRSEGAGAVDAVWPVVVFLHGWGGGKETWEGDRPTGSPLPASLPTEGNTLEAFAMAGFIAVAYDARGFGSSEGLAGVAGPDEIRDLQAVIQHVEGRYHASGKTGVTGVSYGAGQTLLALDLPEVDAAVASYGWADLYHGLLPGDVPKLEWAETLYFAGLAGSGVRLQPFVHDWYQSLYTREGLEQMRSEMALRSSTEKLGSSQVPLLLCQGMQETLFPQADLAWGLSGAFTRAIVRTGGHGSGDCPEARMDWFQFFLAGRDTHVDGWPALRTVDAAGASEVDYHGFPEASWRSWNLRAPDLSDSPSDATFAIEQRFTGNPAEEPSVLWDQGVLPYEALPAELRQDPTAVLFHGPVLSDSMTVLGSAVVTLEGASTPPPYQVAATLLLERDGMQTILSRGASAALDPPDADEPLVIEMPWVKVQMGPGDRLVLKLAANDNAMFMPLLENYSVSFDGRSTIQVPVFGG